MAVSPCGSSSNVSGGSATVNVSSGGCGCGCSGGSADPGVKPPELGGPPIPTGPTGGGTGGSGSGNGQGGGPGGTVGSGPNGEPNPDGLDTQLVGSSCIPLGAPVTRPFGSEGFEFADLPIKTQVLAAVAQLPNYVAGDTVVSAKLQVDGLAWTGFDILGSALTPTRKLSMTDTNNERHLVAYKEERGGGSANGIPVSILSYRYADSFSVDLQGPNEVKIDGQFRRFILDLNGPGGADENSPAWSKVAVCSAIVRHKAALEKGFGFNFSFPHANIAPIGFWDDSGINIRAYFTNYTAYTPNATWNSDYIVTGATGGVPGQSRIVITKVCDLPYTKLSGTFRHGNAGYTPTISLQFEEYNPNTGNLIGTVGGSLTIGPLAATGAVPGDYDNNLPEQSYSLTFPALTPGSYYRLLFALDAGIGLDNLVGTFAI